MAPLIRRITCNRPCRRSGAEARAELVSKGKLGDLTEGALELVRIWFAANPDDTESDKGGGADGKGGGFDADLERQVKNPEYAKWYEKYGAAHAEYYGVKVPAPKVAAPKREVQPARRAPVAALPPAQSQPYAAAFQAAPQQPAQAQAAGRPWGQAVQQAAQSREAVPAAAGGGYWGTGGGGGGYGAPAAQQQAAAQQGWAEVQFQPQPPRPGQPAAAPQQQPPPPARWGGGPPCCAA